VAVAALVTFRRRGLATDSPDVDALVVLLPVVVPLAVADASRWLLPLVLRRVTGRGMALGPGRLVGLRRVVASPEAATGVVSALVLALTVAALGTAVDRSLEAGAVDASWRDVGAPYVIDTREPEVRDAVLTAVPEATVAAAGSTRVNVGRGESNYSVQLETLDVLADAAITDGTAADLGLPDELAALDEDGRVPVVAADRIGGRPVAPGDVLAGLGASGSPGYVVVDTRPEGFGRTRDWIVADRSTLAAVTGREPSFSELSIDAPDDARGTIEAIAVDAGERFAARADELDELLDDPLSRAVRLGYLLAAGGALVFALVAMTAVGVVTARQRRRQVAILGLLGAGRRELGRAVAAELVPAVVAGVVLGAAVGWSVVVLYDGRYDLSSFAGGSPSSIAPDPVAFAVLAAATAVVSVALVTNVVRRIVRAGVSEVLRLDGAA
jgi:hypothetical protein